MRTGIYEGYEDKMRKLSQKMQTGWASLNVLAIAEGSNPVFLEISTKSNGADSQENDFSYQVDVNHLLVKSRF